MLSFRRARGTGGVVARERRLRLFPHFRSLVRWQRMIRLRAGEGSRRAAPGRVGMANRVGRDHAHSSRWARVFMRSHLRGVRSTEGIAGKKRGGWVVKTSKRANTRRRRAERWPRGNRAVRWIDAGTRPAKPEKFQLQGATPADNHFASPNAKDGSFVRMSLFCERVVSPPGPRMPPSSDAQDAPSCGESETHSWQTFRVT